MPTENARHGTIARLETAAQKDRSLASAPQVANLTVTTAESETLADVAYRQLRIDIIRGERKPGERLRIEKLKSIYGIGPTPVREALQKLTADQLVVTQGNRGFAVAPLKLEEFEDLNIARTSIEKEAIRLSIKRGDNNWEANIVAAHYLLKKEDQALAKLKTGIPDSWENANSAFHTAIVDACGSSWLLRTRASLADLCERYRRTSIYQRQGERDLAVEHAAITEAVLDRDALQACSLIDKHFTKTVRAFIDSDTQVLNNESTA